MDLGGGGLIVYGFEGDLGGGRRVVVAVVAVGDV